MLENSEIQELESKLTGSLLRPGDSNFPSAVMGFNLASSYSPELALVAGGEADVAEAVKFAAKHKLPIRILGTGHGPTVHISDGMLIVTRNLNRLSINPETGVATIGAGLKWEAVQAAAAPMGLTAITGSSPDVGAIGLTLGGGLGPLGRSHGATSDYVKSLRVVTGDGELRTASAEENPDLFWALRGGKGGFGVVTEMEIQLAELPVIYAGALIFGTDQIEPVLRGWIDWTGSAPEDVTTSVAVMRLPDLEQLPEPMRGLHGLAVRFAYPGDAETGEALAKPLRDLGTAMADMIGELPTSMMGLIHNDPTDPMPANDIGRLLSGVDQDLATALLSQVGAGTTSPLVITEIRQLGGRLDVDVPEGSSYGGRGAKFSLYSVGAPDPRLAESVIPQALGSLLSAVEPWISNQNTVNFAGKFESWDHFRSAWPPEIFDRLQKLRGKFDPQGLFTYGPTPD
ncbi:MAG: FAD-binding oxidoreductase [Cryobacterium sp.]|nr:FAD-binding oxidoreductase [Cryobacterium sp.]